ncbi:MAG: hypothetical protein LVQ96_01705 [Thermoplasmatales archaeon]|nr:hypothetical protein [Thermoplasmatales archaeon]MCW6169869.1 hypothetical protein [Thermoplasmatales archaeon]
MKELGYDCKNASLIEGYEKCLDGDEVDIDCLRNRMNFVKSNNMIVESHFAHLLGCDLIIILQRDTESVRRTLSNRGYSKEKIEENIDALLSDTIYYESLEFLPAPLIRKVKVTENNLDDAVLKCVEVINSFQKRN